MQKTGPKTCLFQFNVVDLLGQLSDVSGPLSRLVKMATSGELDRLVAQPARDHSGQLRTQRQRRLTPERQLELVERYRAGALMRELAEIYGIERRTVGKIVKRHGRDKT